MSQRHGPEEGLECGMVSPPNGPRHALKVFETAETLPSEMERTLSRCNRWKGAPTGPMPVYSHQLRDLRATASEFSC